jgi:predicted ABC-type ATPase
MPSPPQALIIAGSNGSGKSTAAVGVLPAGMPFINADLIAQEISGRPGAEGDITAGRLLIQRVEALLIQKEDFAFETTLATKKLKQRVEAWRLLGYEISLVFFWLPSVDLAVERVASRVRAGGHNVPAETIERRYVGGLRNFFEIYRDLADTWHVYDNSGEGPRLIARGGRLEELQVFLPEQWIRMQESYETSRS